MIELNVVSRISEDKNFFSDLIEAVYELENKGIDDVHILFIGTIYSEVVYLDIINLASKLGVAHKIAFTKTSIPLLKLTNDIKNGYFINFTIGVFTGYSGLESIRNGFKTIFYNIDKSLQDEPSDLVAHCSSLTQLVSLISNIHKNKEKFNRDILSCNREMNGNFTLRGQKEHQLLLMMLPN